MQENLCVRGIDFASFYDFDILFWNCFRQCGIFFIFYFFHFVGKNVDKINLDIELVIWTMLLYSVSVDQSCIFMNKICTNNACDFQIHFLTEKAQRPYFDIFIILVVPISAVIFKHKYNPGTKNNNGTKIGVYRQITKA